MKLYRRRGKGKEGTVIHTDACRYATAHNSFRWEWSDGRTALEVANAIRGLGSRPCARCRPFDHEGVYG